MQRVLYVLVVVAMLAGCKKDGNSRVEIFMLKSFTSRNDTSVKPFVVNIENVVLEDQPLVTNTDILYYNQSTFTYKLDRNIQSRIANYGADKAFAVVVDGDPVYYGKFHPAYMSSIAFGIATIDPILLLNNNELTMRYVGVPNEPAFNLFDKRNDGRIIRALKNTDRLR